MNIIPKELWENCPDCNNEGGRLIHCCGGDEERCMRLCPDIEQCEFCYVNPNSVFNQTNLINKGT